MFPLLLTATVLPPGVGTARGGEMGTCYVATIREPFAIPEGGMHPPGRLRICESARISPVETIHVVYVDGMPEGAFRFRVAPTSDRKLADGSAVFLFARQNGGPLRLEGLASRRGTVERTLVSPSPRMAVPSATGRATVSETVVLAAMQDR
jgi:hypothetical protein